MTRNASVKYNKQYLCDTDNPCGYLPQYKLKRKCLNKYELRNKNEPGHRLHMLYITPQVENYTFAILFNQGRVNLSAVVSKIKKPRFSKKVQPIIEFWIFVIKQ